MRSLATLLIPLMLCLLPLASPLYMNLEGRKEYCFFVTVADGTNLTVSYVVSGYNEQLVGMKVYSPSGELVSEMSNKKEHFLDIFITESGKQKICFTNMDGTTKILAFDFLEAEKRKDSDVATKESLEAVVKELKKNLKQLQIVYKNQQFQQVRDQVHAETITQTEDRVKWCSIFKIVVLILICVSQIYILTSFFSDKKKVGV